MRGTLVPSGKGGAHDVVLSVDAPDAAPERRHVELCLDLAAAEGGVALRIDRLVQLAAGPEERCAGAALDILVAGLAGQASEDEAAIFGVVGGGFEAERSPRAPDAGLDGARRLDLQIRIADVECLGRLMHAA